MKTKYVIFNNERAIVFDHQFWHRGFHYREKHDDDMIPTSAGFVEFNANPDTTIDVHCFGESVSLNLSSKEGDEAIVRKALGL